jgi:hypothetical protein
MDALLTAVTAKSTVFGYIDPGTGSLIFQVVAASIVSAGLFFKGARERVMFLMYKIFGSKKASASEGDDVAETQPLEMSRKAA